MRIAWRWMAPWCLMVSVALAGGEDKRAEAARALLLRFHADKAGCIEALKLDAAHLDNALRCVDRYARWLRPAQREPAWKSAPAGIGADLFQREGSWWLAPWRGGALERAGVHRHARLLAIDGEKVAGLSRDELAARLRGAPDSVVCLELRIDRDTRSPCLLRLRLAPRPVEWLGGRSLRIRRFRSHETRILLQRMIEELGPDADKPLRIDLRDNPGGDLHEALDCAALFLPPETPLARLHPLDGGADSMARAPAALPSYRMPLWIEVGKDTASAAEIFAGVLQYHHRARLLGKKTFGKCVSQADFPLPDGSRLRLSNLAVRFPDGGGCEGRGLTPDAAAEPSATP